MQLQNLKEIDHSEHQKKKVATKILKYSLKNFGQNMNPD